MPFRSLRPRPLRRTPPNSFLVLVILIFLVVSRFWTAEETPQPTTPTPTPASAPETRNVEVESRLARVSRVVDGDTLLLEGGERVRLLGIDTPETKIPNQPPEPFGPEASDYTTRMASGKTVRLEFDRERLDQYQRTLAYVYVDDVFLNEEIIRQGFSTAQVQYPYRDDMKRRFLKAEQEARDKKIGIWTLDPPPRTPRYRN